MDLASSTAWRCHQATNHSIESLRRNRHTLDWANQPRPYKRYVAPLPTVPLSVEAAADVFDLRLLSKLLMLSAGITKHLTFPGGTMAFRAAACTGALYHVELYVVCGDLPGLAAGVYHFDVERTCLTRLREGDFRGVLAEAAGDDAIRYVPATLAATSAWWRNAWKYQARAYRHAYWDSGTILANLLAVAAEHELPAGIRAGFVDSAVNRLLDVEPAQEAALELVPLGHPGPEAPPAPEVRRLGLETRPYSFNEIEYPLIGQAHQATSLADVEDVARSAFKAPPLEAARRFIDGPIDPVIRRRGSARRFATSPVPHAILPVLANATGPLPADWDGMPASMYVIVNAVDGLASGAYFFDRERQVLDTLRLGEYRELARHLDLGQDLAGDAALDVYFLADLAAVLDRFGERGYRAAQLDASITAGKLYLASYAAGLAATGLTFFDDEVVDFFSPHAAGKSVMFLLAIGNRAPRLS